MKIGVKGTFTLTVRDAEGAVKQELKFDNLITDLGMDRIASVATAGPIQVQDLWDRMLLSTNSAAPTVGDTSIGGTTAQSTTASAIYPDTTTSLGSPLWKHVWQVGYRYNAGTATGTWSSVGLAMGTTPFCRTLILAGGTPTSITILASESLDVRYELTLTPPLTDVSGSVVINGTTYSWTGRCWGLGDVVNATSRKRAIGDNVGIGNGPRGALVYGPSIALGAVNAGNLGAESLPPQTGVTQVLQSSGGTISPSGVVAAAYTNGSFTRTITVSWPADRFAAANLVNGCTYRAGGPTFPMQFVFSPAIPKTNLEQLNLVFSVTWSRV